MSVRGFPYMKSRTKVRYAQVERTIPFMRMMSGLNCWGSSYEARFTFLVDIHRIPDVNVLCG